MKATQKMIDLFGETLERVPRREIEEGIQAVLDLIEREYVPIEALKFNAVMVRKAQDAAGLGLENDARAAVHAVLSCVREKANALSGDPV